jgi:hypothetical protein
VLSYRRDEVVARRHAAGLPVNLDQKEVGDKPTGHTSASISIEPGEVKVTDGDPSSNASIVTKLEKTSRPEEIKPNVTHISSDARPPLENVTTTVNERAVIAAKTQLTRAKSEPGIFKNWTRPLHGLALAARQDGGLEENIRVLLLGVKNTSVAPLKLIPGTPDLTLEMHDDKDKVINVQSIKPLHIEMSDSGGEVGVGRTIYYAIAYTPPLMSVRHQLKVVVAQSNAADEPASITILK